MSNYKERFRHELERVGENVSQLSKELGVARNTLYNWAEKANVPLDKLMLLAEKGVNVEYILLGNQTNPPVSEQEGLLLREFGKLSDEQKQLFLGMLIGGISCMNKLVINSPTNSTIVNHVN